MIEPMTPTELHEWRKRHRIRQADLAWLLKVDQSTICRWEIGIRKIPPHLRLALEQLGDRYLKGAS